MKCKAALWATVAILALSLTSQGGVPMLLSHQGRLLDASDEPVTGMRDMTFHIYDVETGGAPLWSELHEDVSVNDGLYHVTLGGSVTVSGDLLLASGGTARFLEIEVSGEILTPRLRLVAAPYAVGASRVSGDVETMPGELSVSGLGGSTTATIRSSNNPGASGSELEMKEEGEKSLRVASDPEQSTIELRAYRPGRPAYGNITFEAQESRSILKTYFETGDIPTQSELVAQNGNVVIEFKLSDGTSDRSSLMSVDSTSSSSIMIADLDRDGISDLVAGRKVDDDVIDFHEVDSDDDGFVDRRYLIRSGAPAVSAEMTIDDDNDGFSESSILDEVTSAAVNREVKRMGGKIAMRVDSGGSSLELLDSSTTTGAKVTGSWTSANVPIGSVSGGALKMAADNDGDGHSEANANIAALLNGNVVIGCLTDADDDGAPEFFNELSTSPSGARHDISWNTVADLGENDNKRITLRVTPIDASGELSSDSDGDGVLEKNIGLYVSEVTGQAEMRSSVDSDEDGIPESETELSCGNEGARSILSGRSGSTTGTIRMSTNADSVTSETEVTDGSSSSSSNMRTRINELEAKLQSIGFLGTARVTTKTSPSSVSDECRWVQDDTPDGETVYMSTVCDSDGAVTTWSQNDNADDYPNIKVRVDLKDEFDNSRCGVYLDSDSDNDGVSEASLYNSIDDNEVSLKLSKAIADGDASLQAQLNAQKSSLSIVPSTPGTYAFELVCSESSGPIGGQSSACFIGPSDDTTIILHGDGRFGIGVSNPVNPIEHSSGAHLTFGGDWTNASDENLKENFTDVNGEELLERIENLSISQWNYKNEDESVTHIGPTAQDFKAAFGVGSDDKSISTIDPSGIALAAIKELYKQLKNKDAEMQELKLEIARLKAASAEKNAK